MRDNTRERRERLTQTACVCVNLKFHVESLQFYTLAKSTNFVDCLLHFYAFPSKMKKKIAMSTSMH